MQKSKKKLFVIDTNVLIADPMCLVNFNDNRVHVPFKVLEELDNLKKGHTELARNAREATRQLEILMENEVGHNIYSINDKGGILTFTTKELKESIPFDKSNDNIILAETYALQQELKESGIDVILVSRDINLRVKSKSLLIETEDYKYDQALMDSEYLPDGVTILTGDDLPDNAFDKLVQIYNTCQDECVKIDTFYHAQIKDGSIFNLEDTICSFRVMVIYDDYMEVKPLKDYSSTKQNVWGIRPKNFEQNIALNLLMDNDIKLVSIVGGAGCGKTLITLASALALVFDEKKFARIVITRETVVAAGSEEIGFLPGTKLEKLGEYMGPMYDNLKVLVNEDSSHAKDKNGNYKKNSGLDQILENIEVESIGLMRGRSFGGSENQGVVLIIDEAQNISLNQAKLILTRAGEFAKVILLGNLDQIDTPYISASSSGLTHVVRKFADWEKFGHIILKETVRSELADEAVKRL
jgi:PhoH-like ATPase